ncbi:hypothetical protein LZ318_39665 [Saccharopolyspora indica]|uniref:hypothetical protein n=1 Tax=Saccharopolyspora indica TaxID=1229659 RepID=UPI0022EB3D0F|nr:hypothetical protein [Saccharopolyspora indica]MDA3649324.1 hypothetical protein [Saccharopolyspora indica]
MPEAEILLDADTLLEGLQALRERRDESIETNIDILRDPARRIQEIRFEIDDQLAESEFTMVEQSVTHAIGLINTAVDDAQLDELCRLASIHLPGDPEPNPFEAPDPNAFLRTVGPELPKFGEIAPRASYDEDAFIDALKAHRDVCAQRIRDLLEQFSSDLWPTALEYAGVGSASVLAATLEACQKLADDLREAYELWILWLNELYTDNPSHLGTVGEVTHDAMNLFIKRHRTGGLSSQ